MKVIIPKTRRTGKREGGRKECGRRRENNVERERVNI